MWPLISPPKRAPVSFIFCLISEWPAFHMIGRPPRALYVRKKVLRALHFRDKRGVFVPLHDLPGEDDHQIVSPDHLSLIVHHADPVRVPVIAYAHVGLRREHRRLSIASRFFSTVGSGKWWGKRPSISQKSGVTSMPISSMIGTATTPPVPLPASTTTFRPRSMRIFFLKKA